MDQRDVTPLLSKVILFRSGGFGDILLTIPVLSILEIKFREVMLCVPGKYHFLIKEFSSRILLFDLDEGEDQIIKHASGATLLSFWDDPEWIKKWEDAGVSQTYIFNPRPQKGEHFTKSIIDRLGGSVSRFDLDRIWLMPKNNIPSTISGDLWIHPGSGSSDKNLALSSFLNFAEQWLDKQEENRVFFSLGEADSSIMTKLNKTHYLNSTRIDFCIFESLESFYCKLVKHTGPFISNDTGPSHLAAMLGLQTHTFFKSTRPDIWAPLGPNVKIYCADSVPKRIL